MTPVLFFPRFSKAQLAFDLKPQAIQHPGSAGGKGYYDQKGQWQYGAAPAYTPSKIWEKHPEEAARHARYYERQHTVDPHVREYERTGRPVEFERKSGDRTSVALLSKRPTKAGGHRITHFDERGPSGHTEHDTIGDAVKELRSNHQLTGRVNQGHISRWSPTDTWKEGIHQVHHAKVWNEKRYKWNEEHAGLYQRDKAEWERQYDQLRAEEDADFERTRAMFKAASAAFVLLKASQLGFSFGSGPKKEVQEPGSRGGHGYFDDKGHWQYGTPPAGVRAEERPPLRPWNETSTRWPRQAKTYADATPEAAVEDYEVLEPEFIGHYRERMLTRARRNLEAWKQHSVSGRRRRSSTQVVAWQHEWQRWSDPNPAQIESQRESARKVYAKLVKEAISKGKAVPAPVIAQRPEFRVAQSARARYEKGRHTSFANVSLAVNRTMQDRRGYKAKRQDGEMLTMGQLAEIEEGVDAIEQVTGPLGDMLRKVDVTIAHTNGKQPFLRKAGGLYSPDEVTVTVGIKGCSALAHELAHMIDHVAGKALSKKRRIYRKGRTIETDSLAEMDARDSGNPETQLDRTLLSRARASMTNERQVRVDLKTSIKAVAGSERERIQKVNVMLGPYWSEPCELWARLVEQYVATQRRGKGKSFAHDTAEWYEAAPGWWNPEAFAKLAPAVKVVLDHRLAALRGQVATSGPPANQALLDAMAGASSTRTPVPPPQWTHPLGVGVVATRPPEYADTTRPLQAGEVVYHDVGGLIGGRGGAPTPPGFERAIVERVTRDAMGDAVHYRTATGQGGWTRRHKVFARGVA